MVMFLDLGRCWYIEPFPRTRGPFLTLTYYGTQIGTPKDLSLRPVQYKPEEWFLGTLLSTYLKIFMH